MQFKKSYWEDDNIYFSDPLEKLKLKRSDLSQLSENEKLQKIRWQWMSLCLQAKNRDEVNNYTCYYHRTFRKTEIPHSIGSYFDQKNLSIPHTMFSFSQREQIEKSYHDLLTDFSKLSTETEKQNFATNNAEFLNLAQSLIKEDREFEKFLGLQLFSQNHKTLQTQIIEKWRIQMVRLYGIEGLDDFAYRQALTSRDLGLILSKDKLFSPIRLLVGIINSLILIITTSFDFMLDYHETLRIIFNILIFAHPSAIVIVQLPQIAKILEMLACPRNQIIRPLCAYTQWAPTTVTLLLSAAALAVLYIALYTTLLTTFAAWFFYFIPKIFYAYNLYLLSELWYELICKAFKTSFIHGCVTLSYMACLSILLISIKLALNTEIKSNNVQPPSVFNLFMGLYSVFSFASIWIYGSQNMPILLDRLPLSLPCQPIPETIRDTVLIKCNTANLSHRFFNTPKDAPAIPRIQISENGSVLGTCFQ